MKPEVQENKSRRKTGEKWKVVEEPEKENLKS